MEKHEYLEDQLQRSAEALKQSGGEGKHHEKHQLLEEKTNNIGYKVESSCTGPHALTLAPGLVRLSTGCFLGG